MRVKLVLGINSDTVVWYQYNYYVKNYVPTSECLNFIIEQGKILEKNDFKNINVTTLIFYDDTSMFVPRDRFQSFDANDFIRKHELLILKVYKTGEICDIAFSHGIFKEN